MAFKVNYPYHNHMDVLPTPLRLGAHPDYTGRGVVMAFLDSGFSMHPDIAARVRLHVDASTRDIVEQPKVMAMDMLSWHGQMTSVIAAGNGHNSNGKYRGLASDADLVLIRVGTPTGEVKEKDILRGLQWLVKHHQEHNIRIVNISVGGDFVSNNSHHPIHADIRLLVEQGVTVLVAAGNSGLPNLVPPASSAAAITVGGYDDHNSLDRNLWKLYHHNYGTAYDHTRKPEIVTTAAWIASPILPDSTMEREARWLAPLLSDTRKGWQRLLEGGFEEIEDIDAKETTEHLHAAIQARINRYKLIDDKHQHVDGTSVSVAIAASVVAQMLEANPKLTPTQIRTILTSTAKPLPNAPHERQGAGVLDAARAVTIAMKDFH